MDGNDLSLAAWKRVAKVLPAELQGYAREWAEAVEHLERAGTERAATLEWQLWRSLCDVLSEAGAVTAEDLKAPIRNPSGTHGSKIFQALRAWGAARRAVVREPLQRAREEFAALPKRKAFRKNFEADFSPERIAAAQARAKKTVAQQLHETAEIARATAMEAIDALTERMTVAERVAFRHTLIDTLTVEQDAERP